MGIVPTATLLQNLSGKPELPEYLPPLDGLVNESKGAMLDPFFRSNQFMSNSQLSTVLDEAEALRPELLTQAVNNDSRYPESFSMSDTAPDYLFTLPSNGYTPASLVRNSKTPLRGRRSRSSNIEIRPGNKNVDEENVANATKRSQRARKAANKRHGQRRRDSTRNEEMDELERRREGNRVAAAKCRQKQLLARDALYERHQELCASNKRIKREVCALREQLLSLRSLALQHMDCGCGALREYNIGQASRVVSTAHQDGDDDLSSPDRIAQSCIFSSQLPLFNDSKDMESRYIETV